MKLKIFFWATAFGLWLMTVNPAHAASEFITDFSVEYAVSPKETTIVTNKISLTNKLSNIYPKEYKIVYDSDKIDNIIASDNGGFITPVVVVENGQTTVKIPFSQKVIGVGKKLDFLLRFENHEIVKKNGSIWEMQIPGVKNAEEINNYNVTLSTPMTFGTAAYLVPAPADQHRWTKDQLTHGGISAAYGDMQRFTVSLIYFLENTESKTGEMSVALPPDTAYQKVFIRNIDPKPVKINEDTDGNWLAFYKLKPKEKLKITADLLTFVTVQPRKDFVQKSVILEKYTKPTNYWNTNDLNISRLAAEYDTPREIYDYVRTALKYKYPDGNSPLTRYGAVETLKHKNEAVCTEFTDLFVAIARAAGIPARSVVGYAYTTNPKLRPLSLLGDVLHAWPEYYDQHRQIWVPIDPTWANTTGGINYFDKLDFNHIAFAINGIEDDLPLPAGLYTESGSVTQKLVDVNFADPTQSDEYVSGTTTSINIPKYVLSYLPIGGYVKITNAGGASINQKQVIIKTNPETRDITYHIDTIPPLNSVEIPVRFTMGSLLAPISASIKTTIADDNVTYNFIVLPVLIYFVFLICIGAVIFLCINIYILYRR